MSTDYVAIGHQYALDVVAERESELVRSKQNRYVRLACQRQLEDLERKPSDEWPWEWVPKYGQRRCAFLETLKHVKGEWRGQPFLLQPWQTFRDTTVQGWRHRDDQRIRRFKGSYEEIPRKCGKSLWAASDGNAEFTIDAEPAAEVYCGATSEDQAHFVFGQAYQQMALNPELRKMFGVQLGGKTKFGRMVRLADNAVFAPVIGKPGDGAMPSYAIIDEFHEHDTPDLVETLQTGMGSRIRPFLRKITTAGDNMGGPCFMDREMAISVLEGQVRNERLFVLIYTIDAGVSWTSEAALWMANPNLGVSVKLDWLKSEQQDAINDATKQSQFKRKHLNIWVAARDPWMNMEWWNRQVITNREAAA